MERGVIATNTLNTTKSFLRNRYELLACRANSCHFLLNKRFLAVVRVPLSKFGGH